MLLADILRRCIGETFTVNGKDERKLISVEEDFVVLQGGNPQLRLTDFVPLDRISRVTRLDYTGGEHAMALEIVQSGADRQRDDSHF